MLDKSLFVSAEIHQRTVELPDGTKGDFHFRELRAAEIQRYRHYYNHRDMAERDKAVPYLISQAVRNEDGTEAITIDDAMRLKPSVADRFAEVVLDLAGFGSGNP